MDQADERRITMQFTENATVYTADGQEVGAIDRVVIDPETKEVSHVVVRKGWLFTEDKVVPTTLIDQASADQVRLRADAGKLDDLPDFEETHYLPYDRDYAASGSDAGGSGAGGGARPVYSYPPIGASWLGGFYGGYGYPMRRYYAAGNQPGEPYVAEVERNIPEGTVALKEGASVFDSTGSKVGSVARVFTDSETQEATHLLVAEGWLFKEERLVPINWVRDVTEEAVHLTVDADFLRGLPEYRK
jgi:sporulation protein YlmC with PRC-barrel domain